MSSRSIRLALYSCSALAILSGCSVVSEDEVGSSEGAAVTAVPAALDPFLDGVIVNAALPVIDTKRAIDTRRDIRSLRFMEVERDGTGVPVSAVIQYDLQCENNDPEPASHPDQECRGHLHKTRATFTPSKWGYVARFREWDGIGMNSDFDAPATDIAKHVKDRALCLMPAKRGTKVSAVFPTATVGEVLVVAPALVNGATAGCVDPKTSQREAVLEPAAPALSASEVSALAQAPDLRAFADDMARCLPWAAPRAGARVLRREATYWEHVDIHSGSGQENACGDGSDDNFCTDSRSFVVDQAASSLAEKSYWGGSGNTHFGELVGRTLVRDAKGELVGSFAHKCARYRLNVPYETDEGVTLSRRVFAVGKDPATGDERLGKSWERLELRKTVAKLAHSSGQEAPSSAMGAALRKLVDAAYWDLSVPAATPGAPPAE